jgi:hypothetical protein
MLSRIMADGDEKAPSDPSDPGPAQDAKSRTLPVTSRTKPARKRNHRPPQRPKKTIRKLIYPSVNSMMN